MKIGISIMPLNSAVRLADEDVRDFVMKELVAYFDELGRHAQETVAAGDEAPGVWAEADIDDEIIKAFSTESA